MRFFLFLIIILTPWMVNSQTCYSGFLGKQPITLVTKHYGDGLSRAYYVYDEYDTSIILNGTLTDTLLTLFERDVKRNISASLRFKNFKEEADSIMGKWINKDSTQVYDILLKKEFVIGHGKTLEWDTIELIQSKSTKDHYFKTIITKEKGKIYARVSGVKIFEKITDKLLQTIKLDCQLMGIDNLSIGDFNFDGVDDLSVFEASYSGPNTTHIYILRIPDDDKYFVSDFSGVSLEFSNGLIYEHNQCCAGRSHINTTYKVVDNKMILIEQKCIEYNEEKEDFIEIECD